MLRRFLGNQSAGESATAEADKLLTVKLLNEMNGRLGTVFLTGFFTKLSHSLSSGDVADRKALALAVSNAMTITGAMTVPMGARQGDNRVHPMQPQPPEQRRANVGWSGRDDPVSNMPGTSQAPPQQPPQGQVHAGKNGSWWNGGDSAQPKGGAPSRPRAKGSRPKSQNEAAKTAKSTTKRKTAKSTTKRKTAKAT